MPAIEWKERLSVNVARIDAEHKKLIALINKLDDAMKEGKGMEIIGDIIDELINYARTHFKTEEDFFVTLRYPETSAHVGEHAAFVKKVQQFKSDFDEGKHLVSVPVINFLTQWIWDHIKGSDQKYTPFLNKNGIY